MAEILRLRAGALLLAALSLAAGPLAGQQAVPDTAHGATGDSAAAPRDTLPTATDTAQRATPGLTFPSDLGGRATHSTAVVRTWERRELLDATAITLADFLQDHAPGVHLLRAGYFFGPHHLADGLRGPASVRVFVDGREMLPVSASQPDLSRISLVALDRVQLERRPGETVVRVNTIAHDGGEAYSRVDAGTGQPAADMVGGLFLNNAGRHVAVGAAVSYLNIAAGSAEGNRLDALGKAAWMPFGPDLGLELLYRSESVERAEGGTTGEFSRSGFVLRLRSNLTEGVQLDAWGETATRDPRPPFLPAPEPPGEPGASEDGSLGADQLGAGLTVLRGPVRLEARAELIDAGGLPEARGELRGAVQIGPLVAEGEYGTASWDGFRTSDLSAGLALKPDPFPLTFRAGVAGGSRAVPRPGREVADSATFDFDAVGAGADVVLGSYELGGGVERQTQEMRPAFQGSFDVLVPTGPEAEVTSWEARLAGPLLPVGALEERLLLTASWRSSSFGEGEELPYYVPRELGRASLRYHDRFFEDNLEVRLALVAERRGEMLTARTGSATPELLEPRTVLGTDLLIRIDVFRIWWRVESLRGEEHQDFADLPFPAQRNLFGVRWEFFN